MPKNTGEGAGDCVSQMTVNILVALSLALFSLLLRLHPIYTGFVFRTMTELARRQVKVLHSTFQGSSFVVYTSLTSLCGITKHILSEYDTCQLIKHHKLFGNGFEKDTVTITCVLFCHSTCSCSLGITLFRQIVIILPLANSDFLSLHIH